MNRRLTFLTVFITWELLKSSNSQNLYPLSFSRQAASGAEADMTTITPASGCALAWASMIYEVVGAATDFCAVKLTNELCCDNNTLDVFAVHSCDGFMGSLFA